MENAFCGNSELSARPQLQVTRIWCPANENVVLRTLSRMRSIMAATSGSPAFLETMMNSSPP